MNDDEIINLFLKRDENGICLLYTSCIYAKCRLSADI